MRTHAGRLSQSLALLLVLMNVAEAVRTYPNYLAYFNPLAGPADQRWRHLVDSSLDWGQELPSLSDWLKEHQRPEERVFLSYFGVDDPRDKGIQATSLAPYASLWTAPRLARLTPGLYCISATMLQDSYSPLNGPWTPLHEKTFQILSRHFESHPDDFASPDAYVLLKGNADENRRWLFERTRFARLAAYLRVRRPDAVINSAMLIYRLDSEEVSLATDSSTETWVKMIEQAFLQKGLTVGP